MMERYDAYNPFAALYDERWGGMGIARLLPDFERLVLGDLRAGARILDVCCGTGQFAAALGAREFDVVGVDGSEEMLRYARRNAPGASFVCADAREFDVGTGFDLALSTFDSLNHVMELEGLERVFARVHDALRPGGSFAFDLNTAETFQAKWNGTSAEVRDDRVLVQRFSHEVETNLAEFHLTLFTRIPDSPHWQRSDLSLTQRAFAEDEIRDALAGAGFPADGILLEPAEDHLYVIAVRSHNDGVGSGGAGQDLG